MQPPPKFLGDRMNVSDIMSTDGLGDWTPTPKVTMQDKIYETADFRPKSKGSTLLFQGRGEPVLGKSHMHRRLQNQLTPIRNNMDYSDIKGTVRGNKYKPRDYDLMDCSDLNNKQKNRRGRHEHNQKELSPAQMMPH